MENFKVIEFHEARDFSKKMNVTFEFIRQNFKGLGKSVLFLAGPPALLAGLAFGSFFQDVISLSANPSDIENMQNMFLSPAYWFGILLMMVFSVIATLMVIATINSYLSLYQEKKTNQIEVSEVWERVRETFWKYFRTVLGLVGIVIIAYIAMFFVAGIFTVVLPVLIFPAFVVVFVGFFYLIVSISLVFPIRTFEDIRFAAAIRRSMNLTYGKWWSTFGLLFLLSFISSIIAYLFLIPAYVVMGAATLHGFSGEAEEPSSVIGLVVMASTTLSMLGSVLLSVIPTVGLAFQYFNLVELKESKGLMSNIDTFGQPGSPSSNEEQY